MANKENDRVIRKVKPTVKRSFSGREGWSKGSDYWMHEDIMKQDIEEAKKRKRLDNDKKGNE